MQMKLRVFAMCSLGLILLSFHQRAYASDKHTNWGERTAITFQCLNSHFSQPDMMYAPFAYWFWDAALDNNFIVEMVEAMCQQRLNPGYIHARQRRGIGLPYDEWLSPQWFDAVKNATLSAEANNMYLGYCDEFNWPSGSANGRVVEEYPDLAAISLKWDIVDVQGDTLIKLPESFFTVAAQHDLKSIKSNKDFLMKSNTLKLIGRGKAFDWKVPGGKWRVYSFNKYHHIGIDGGDVNYLDLRLPKIFIDIAHQPYADYLGEKMGSSIPGVFVDHEGDYGFKLAWSEDLGREYKKKKKRDIKLWMPLLIDEDSEGKWVKARWDWYDVVSDIYSNGFLAGVSEWLEDHGMFDISNVWEENLVNQALLVGDFFKAQRAVSLPGNDAVFSRVMNVHDFKETQSVTEFEAKRFQSEILGVTGWNLSPVFMKQSVNSAIAWGVSHIVAHGINLNQTLEEVPYPPSWYKSNPYWPYLHLWTDFARRASFVNSQGHLVPDVLLYNPMSSVWALLGDRIFDESLGKSNYNYMALQNDHHESMCKYGKKIDHLDDVYSGAIKTLTKKRIEYLITDSHYFQQMQILENGRLKQGPFEFKALILPALYILPLDVARKIVDFAAAGGHVYILGELPQWSTDKGMYDPEMIALMSKLESFPNVKISVAGIEELIDQKATMLKSQIQFESGEFSMLQLHRRIDQRDFFWLANNFRDQQDCKLIVHGVKGRAFIWNCETGEKTDIFSESTESGCFIELNFKPYEAYWLVFDPKQEPLTTKKVRKNKWSAVLMLDEMWNVRIDPSVQPSIQSRTTVIPDRSLTKNEKLPLASWLEWGLDQYRFHSGYVDYSKTFELQNSNDELILDLGDVRYMAEVWINGESVGYRIWPPFQFEIGKVSKKGKNEILVRVGNLLGNIMNQPIDSGLLGPVTIKRKI